jgi:hypothetical protein
LIRRPDPAKPEKTLKAARSAKSIRRPPRPSSRVLEAILDELATAKANLMTATEALRAVDTRVRGWDLCEAFMARRGTVLRDEATTQFAHALDALHGLLVRLADRSLGATFATRLSAPGKRRLEAKIRQELRYLQRAFDGGSLLLARTLRSFGAN